MRKSLCVLVLSFFLFSCGSSSSDDDSGGGGSPTSSTNPNKSFSLSKLQSTTLGTVYTTQLTGSDSSGAILTGTLSMANRAQVMLNGVLVTPQDMMISFKAGGEASFTVTGTSNVDTSGNLISLVIQTTGVTCTPVSPDSTRIPTSVKIGDFGILSTFMCDNNTTQEQNWRIEDAGNGNIRVVTDGIIKDQYSTIISVTNVTFSLGGSGNIVAFKTVATQSATNFTLTYESV